MNKFFKKYSFFIGFALLIFTMYKANFKEFYIVLRQVNYYFLFPAFGCTFLMITIKSFRWNYLKKVQGIIYPLQESLKMYAVGIIAGVVTPGRLGDLSKIGYLKKDGYSTGKSLANVIMDRFLDCCFLLLFGYVGIIYFFGFYRKISFILIISLVSLFIIIIFLKKTKTKQIVKYIFLFFIPKKYQQSCQITWQDFFEEIKKYDRKHYLFCSLITIFAWSIYYCQIYFFAQSAGLKNIPLFYLFMAATITIFASLLPVSLWGIGTREITLLALLAPFAIKIELIILLSELILIDYFLSSLIGGIAWQFKPLPITEIFSNKKI